MEAPLVVRSGWQSEALLATVGFGAVLMRSYEKPFEINLDGSSREAHHVEARGQTRYLP